VISDKLRIAFTSLTLYAATIAVALTAAWQHLASPVLVGGVGPLELTWQNGILFALVFAVFTFVMVKFVRVAHASLALFLFIALVVGSQFILAAWVPSPYDIIGALLVALVLWAVPRVLVHDIAIILGIGGIAAVLGLSITPLVACVLLAGLSVYDIVSVYRTRHMVALANRMISSGSVFGFLVPARLSGFLMRRDDALNARSVMVLGSGDIGLPLVLATSALSQSINGAILISVFALGGVMLMHYLFAHQDQPRPMAALPPIAAAAIIGYALSIFFL
jgi:presenilin-like A22 family membrane protease